MEDVEPTKGRNGVRKRRKDKGRKKGRKPTQERAGQLFRET
jgi:hypothetical protein